MYTDLEYVKDKIRDITINNTYRCNRGLYNVMPRRDVKYIAIHYTGNVKDTALANVKYYSTAKVEASCHFFVDDISIYQSVAVKDIAWHIGGSQYYHPLCRNNNAVGIEMCCTAGNYTVSMITQINTAYLCAYLCRILGIKSTEVDTYLVRHYDVTHKTCPAQYVKDPNQWVEFKSMVRNILDTGSHLMNSLIYKGRDYTPVFDATYYSNNYPDLKRAFGNDTRALFNHFITYGMKESRQATAKFNPTIYKSNYADLVNAFKNDMPSYYIHYIDYGQKEGRNGASRI